jgi:hypothetical protein
MLKGSVIFELLRFPGFWRFSVAGSRQDDKEMAMELCGMSVLELEEFLDDKRTHMVEGIVVGQVSTSFWLLWVLWTMLPLSGDLLIDGVQYFHDFYVWKLKRPEDLGGATHPDHGRKDFPCVVMIVA